MELASGNPRGRVYLDFPKVVSVTEKGDKRDKAQFKTYTTNKIVVLTKILHNIQAALMSLKGAGGLECQVLHHRGAIFIYPSNLFFSVSCPLNLLSYL